MSGETAGNGLKEIKSDIHYESGLTEEECKTNLLLYLTTASQAD